jgi:hypothetical protein
MKRREYFEKRGMEMKKYLHIIFGLGLLLTAGGSLVYAAPSTNFWDDAESEVHFNTPVANVGNWSGGEVRDTFIDIIPDTPGGGQKAILVSRDVGWPLVGTATEQAVLTATVTFEFDMYVVGQGAGTSADFMMLNQDYPAGHPLDGTAPHITVTDTASYPTLDVKNFWNDSPTWHADPLGPTVSADAWHHYELDYVVGDVNSLFIAVDGSTPTNVPPPWGWLAYGDPGSDPNARNVLEEITGLMFRPGDDATNSAYYVDNVLLVIDNPPLKVEPATAVAIEDTRVFVFETLLGIRYGLESTADLLAGPWTPVGGLTVLGTGGAVTSFDPRPPGADTEYYRIIVP